MQAPRPRSLLTKRCTTARRGGYVRKGLRPEVGGGPLWRVSNPFATQPSQPRQKAVGELRVTETGVSVASERFPCVP